MPRLEHVVLVNEAGSCVDDLTAVARNLVAVPSRKVLYLVRLLRDDIRLSIDGYEQAVRGRLLVLHARSPLVLL